MNAAENIQAIFDQYMADSKNPRQRESLMRIHKACEYLANESTRITPAAVERYCFERDWDGPKAQSIRNSPVLNRYLNLRKSGQVLKANTNASRPTPLIADESLRAYVNLLIEEREQAIADKARIVKGLRFIPGVPVDTLIQQGFGGNPSIPELKEIRLSPALIAALTRLFDAKVLSDCALAERRNRLVSTLTGNVLLSREQCDAIRELIKSGSVTPASSNIAFPGLGAEEPPTIDPTE